MERRVNITSGTIAALSALKEKQAGFPFWGVRPFLLAQAQENGMFELTKWVRCDGKTYCWDKRSCKVVEVKITDIPLDKVPKDVLVAMLGKETTEE